MFTSILRIFQSLLNALHEASEVYVRRTYIGPWSRR